MPVDIWLHAYGCSRQQQCPAPTPFPVLRSSGPITQLSGNEVATTVVAPNLAWDKLFGFPPPPPWEEVLFPWLADGTLVVEWLGGPGGAAKLNNVFRMHDNDCKLSCTAEPVRSGRRWVLEVLSLLISPIFRTVTKNVCNNNGKQRKMSDKSNKEFFTEKRNVDFHIERFQHSCLLNK